MVVPLVGCLFRADCVVFILALPVHLCDCVFIWEKGFLVMSCYNCIWLNVKFETPPIWYIEKFLSHLNLCSPRNLLWKGCLFVCLMVFNATFNNISGISWRSVLLVDETGGPGEKPTACHWQTLSHNIVTPRPDGDSNSQHHWLHR
jgi:hypothetical protein